jgi:SAM-dependent methyltransferase
MYYDRPPAPPARAGAVGEPEVPRVDWRVKGVTQKVLSVLPAGRRVNGVLQRTLGGLRDLSATVDSKIHDDWLVLVDHLRELQCEVAGATILEIGTGRFPTLPAGFALAGARRCISYDVERQLDWGLTRRMWERFETHLSAIAARLGTSERAMRERWSALAGARTLAEFLERAGLEYRAPADARATGLPAASVDVVFSNSVLEHVDRAAIGPLMRESRRVLRPGGVAVHSVDCSDHYAYFDPGLTPIHYLRFGERTWRLWNNALQYQNRLRPNDFLELAAGEGLQIVLNRQAPRRELLARLDELPIARQFRHYSREQLCTTSVAFAARAPR